jgi:hypothetical protein
MIVDGLLRGYMKVAPIYIPNMAFKINVVTIPGFEIEGHPTTGGSFLFFSGKVCYWQQK